MDEKQERERYPTSMSLRRDTKHVLLELQHKTGMPQTEIIERLVIAFGAKIDPPIILYTPLESAAEAALERWGIPSELTGGPSGDAPTPESKGT